LAQTHRLGPLISILRKARQVVKNLISPGRVIEEQRD